jgi:hypothetical protein
MRDGFDIIENLTILKFYEVSDNEEISITCNETTRYEEGMFIAGEGGPTRVVKAGDLSVILSGTILLIRDSKCEIPNIAIHELLHVLGFTHSTNPNNIMYNFTKCGQVIGDDTVQLINDLYSIESRADLVFEAENTSALMHSRYLDLNMTIKNYGLKDAPESIVSVVVNDKEIKDISVGEITIGNGKIINIQNIWVTKLNPDKIDLVIKTGFEELSKENNIISKKSNSSIDVWSSS